MAKPSQTDSGDPLEDLSPARAAEYLVQLQRQVDALKARTVAQRARIENLERDRETLRAKLELARRPRTRFGKAKTASEPETLAVDPSDVEPAQSPEPRLPVRVAAIVDGFTQQAFAPEWAMLNLRRTNWQADLEIYQPELLFVESAFTGAGGDWAGELARFGSSSETLQEVVAWCTANHVPTVFWNKEDPISFEMFVESARLFDFVFTVDLDSVDRYRRHIPGTSVDVLPFAAQPHLHYPPNRVEDRTLDVAFAGAYYAAKFPERRAQMEIIIEPARSFNLDIFDRFANVDDRFQWPTKYQPHIRGSLSYQETVDAYRQYKVSLNVNTVTTSSTMCSRRIFELLACGAYIVSGRSSAIGAYVPTGLVQVASSPLEAYDLIERGLSDQSQLEAAAKLGPKWIMNGQTYADRVDRILEIVLA